jgi:hypothetical protein
MRTVPGTSRPSEYFEAAALAARVAARATPRDGGVLPWPDGSSGRAVIAISAAIVATSAIVIAAFLH